MENVLAALLNMCQQRPDGPSVWVSTKVGQQRFRKTFSGRHLFRIQFSRRKVPRLGGAGWDFNNVESPASYATTQLNFDGGGVADKIA